MSRMITLVAIALIATGAAAQDLAELEVDHALTFDFPTPHTDWAQPYAGERTRVLFFTDGRGTNPRECVELMQRFDLDAEAVFYAQIVDSSESHWHGGEIGIQRMNALLDQRWDCYVFLKMNMKDMSAEQQYKLLKPVTEGAGLVFAGSDDPRVFKPANQIAELPPILARGPVGDAFAIGAGRGMRLPAQPAIEYHEGWEVEYDYWAERLGRAILWAAGHEPQATLTVDTGPGAFVWDAPKNLTVSYQGEVGGDNARMRLRVRAAGGPSIDLPERSLAKRAFFSFQVGDLPAGEYYADAWIVSAAGVETWTSAQFTVTSPLAVGGVLLDADWGEIGDSIRGRAIVEGAPGADDQLRVGLFDRRGRLLAQQVMPARAGDTRFEFRIEPWMPMLVRVDAALFRNPPGDAPATTIDSAYAYSRVTKRHQDRFNFLIWDVPGGTLAPYAEQSLAENGMTLQLKSGNPPLIVSAFDTAWVPYTTRIMTPKSDEGIMQPFCWNDTEAVQAHVAEKAQEYLGARQSGVYVWSLGDEVMTQGSCLSPYCADAYREYLQEVYGDLDALNDSWNTNFADWADVGLSKAGDNDEANSLAEGHYPRWFDRRAFQSHNFVNFCGAYAEAYRAIDPLSRTGFEGAGRFARGDDLDLIMRENEFWSPYPGVADEVVRSLAAPDFPRSNWMGYTKDADSLLSKYWRMVTRGMTSVWWWRWDCIGRFHGWLAPDLRPFPAVAEIQRDTQVVRDGLGDLLMRSQMQDDGIAVLYSYPAQFACEIEDGPSYGAYEADHVAAHRILRDLGYQFRYVTDRMLRLGEFDADRYRLLILPRIEALGPQEAEVIREFVRGGGVVIADVRPAIYDGHCKPSAQGLLDDVFGITTDGRAAAVKADAQIGDGPTIENLMIDPTVRLRGGSARGMAGDTPVWIENRFGEGVAILLNFTFAGFPGLHVADTPAEMAALMQGLISRQDTHPAALRMLDAEGGRLRNIEAVRWVNGDTELLALFREMGNGETATIVLPAARHVYDLRNRKYLGETARFETAIIPARATFFALCERPVQPPDVTVTPVAVERGQVAQASISVGGAEGLYAFKLMGSAAGSEMDWLDQVVIAGAEPVQVPIPVAYNDPAGEYRITARELFSNREFAATLRVR